MPIAVMCPSCSANFSVKDELAGKRAKCPKCGEPLTIPGGAPVTPTPTPAVAVPAPVAKPVARPVAARPVAVPVKPTDEEDDRPKGKKRRDDEDADEQPKGKKRRDDDADEDRPKSKKRRDDDDAENDKPKDKRRRRDDDDKPKKKSALPLVLGILGVVILVCGGGCAGGWVLWVQPSLQAAASRMKSENDALEAEINKLKAMDGPQSKPGAVDNAIEVLALDITAEYRANEKEAATKYGGKPLRITGKVKELHSGGVVLVGKPLGQYPTTVVAFYTDADKKLPYKPGEWVKAEGKGGGFYPYQGGHILQLLDAKMTPTQRPANLPPDEPPPPSVDPNTPLVTTDAAMIDGFVRDITSPDRMYKGKQIKLTGKVTDINGNTLYFGGREDSNFSHWVEVVTGGVAGAKKGDTVTVVGKYQKYSSSFQNSSRTITLTDGKVESVQPGTPPKPETPPAEAISVKAEDLAAEFDKDAASAGKKYQDKTVTVTGSVEQVTPTGSTVTLKGLAAAGAKKATVVTVSVNPDARDESKKLKPGDTVKLTGKLSGLRGATGTRPNAVTLNSGVVEK